MEVIRISLCRTRPLSTDLEGCAELRLAFDQRTGARNVALVASGLALAAGGTAIALHFTVDKVAPASAGLMVSRSW